MAKGQRNDGTSCDSGSWILSWPVLGDHRGLNCLWKKNEVKPPLWRACRKAGLRQIGWHVCEAIRGWMADGIDAHCAWHFSTSCGRSKRNSSFDCRILGRRSRGRDQVDTIVLANGNEVPVTALSDAASRLHLGVHRRARQARLHDRPPKGSHVRLACAGRPPVTVPMHATIDRGTLRSILRSCEISVEDFVKLVG